MAKAPKAVIWIGRIAQNYQRALAIFMVGQVVFFVGLALFYLSADRYDSTPLVAELMVLIALILLACGAGIALIGYLAITYGRWYHFFKNSPKKGNTTDD